MYNVLYKVLCLQTGIYILCIFVHIQICILYGYGFKKTMLFFIHCQSLIFLVQKKITEHFIGSIGILSALIHTVNMLSEFYQN